MKGSLRMTTPPPKGPGCFLGVYGEVFEGVDSSVFRPGVWCKGRDPMDLSTGEHVLHWN